MPAWQVCATCPLAHLYCLISALSPPPHLSCRVTCPYSVLSHRRQRYQQCSSPTSSPVPSVILPPRIPCRRHRDIPGSHQAARCCWHNTCSSGGGCRLQSYGFLRGQRPAWLMEDFSFEVSKQGVTSPCFRRGSAPLNTLGMLTQSQAIAEER